MHSDIQAEGVQRPEAVFTALGMPKPRRGSTEDGREFLYAAKYQAGVWGAWICHLGILLLIVGFSLGQITREEYGVYGVPGQTRPIGDTGLFVTINDFRVDLREDDTVSQYTADITVRNTANGQTERAEVSVNAPARLFGLTFCPRSERRGISTGRNALRGRISDGCGQSGISGLFQRILSRF